MASTNLEKESFFSAHYSILIIRNAWWLQLTSSPPVCSTMLSPPWLPHQRAAPSSHGRAVSTHSRQQVHLNIIILHSASDIYSDTKFCKTNILLPPQNARIYPCDPNFSSHQRVRLVGFLRTVNPTRAGGGGTVDGA